MGKKIYVNGNIIVKTRYFKFKDNCGAYCPEPPEGAEIWEANKIENGSKFFEITDKNPQSIFNDYYAKEGFTAYDNWGNYLFQSIDEVRDNYNEQISEIKNLIIADNIHEEHNPILYKLYYAKVGTSLDAFICDVILTIITSDEILFEDFSKSRLCHKIGEDDIKKLKAKGAGFFEQKIIYNVLRESYLNTETIKEFFKKFYKLKIIIETSKLNEHFRIRHLLVHRNGRDKEDKKIMINESDIYTFIKEADTLVDEICNKIQNKISVS